MPQPKRERPAIGTFETDAAGDDLYFAPNLKDADRVVSIETSKYENRMHSQRPKNPLMVLDAHDRATLLEASRIVGWLTTVAARSINNAELTNDQLTALARQHDECLQAARCMIGLLQAMPVRKKKRRLAAPVDGGAT